jgi:GH25 family lysozyme M1 (1,4-beta-N-acetylmuramidase)
MATIEGIDISRYQGVMTSATINKLKEKNVKFVYVRFSQGENYKDQQAENNTKLLQDAGILVGPYHFVTTANAINQYNWFIKCMGDFQFDLPPAMDCEAYSSTLSFSGESVIVPTMRMKILAQEHPEMFLPHPGQDFSAVLTNGKIFVGNVYSYTYPTEAIVDVIGLRLTEWMKSQTKLTKFPYPVIYTNASSGNVIFKSLTMSRYLLWVANWNVQTPYLPKIWTNKPYLLWQNYVIKDASDYGIAGSLDHDVWGNYMEFPGGTTPPPVNNTVKVTLEFPDKSIFTGTLDMEE